MDLFVHQDPLTALVTMEMCLHLTTTMMSSPTQALKTSLFDEPSSEKYILNFELVKLVHVIV